MRKALQQDLAQGNINQVIARLLKTTTLPPYARHQEAVVRLSARWEALQAIPQNSSLKIIQAKKEKAAISQSLLGIINQLPEAISPQPRQMQNNPPLATPSKKEKERASFWERLGKVAIVIGILAGIAEIMGMGLSDIFWGAEQADSFAVTVVVHGTGGKDDLLLKNQGKVALEVGGDKRLEAINEEGEATFKELPDRYKNTKALVSIVHPQPYFPTKRNAEYALEANTILHLEVALQGMDKIEGLVIDATSSKPLDSVRVSVGGAATFTNPFGEYELDIPQEKQSKFVRMMFHKSGYKMQLLDSVAPHTKQKVDMVMKRD